MTKSKPNAQIIIPINSACDDFARHISDPQNSRIVFSGKFGIGKTYFLKEFFKDKNNEYEVIHLSPVDYQINQNDDIINLLQYDILLSLIDRFGESLLNEKTNILVETAQKMILSLLPLIPQAAQTMLVNNQQPDQTKIFVSVLVLNILGKLGKQLINQEKVIEWFQSVFGKQDGKVTEFLSEISRKSLSSKLSMRDIISCNLDDIRNGRQVVLIIDDLDRVDPAHIFRLLNVFSACLDYADDEQKNLFGFDKVIIVADYNNLKSIFRHCYGVDTDFNGYFDKFFAAEVFHFNNEMAVQNIVNGIISNLQYNSQYQSVFNKIFDPINGSCRFLLHTILYNAIKVGELNLRQLMKGTQIKLEPLSNFSTEKVGINVYSTTEQQEILLSINVGLDILTSILGGDSDKTLQVLTKIHQNLTDESHYFYATYMQILASILLPQKQTKESDQTTHMGHRHDIQYAYKGGKFIGPNDLVSGTAKLLFDMLIEYYGTKKYKEPIQKWHDKEYIY